MEMTFWPAGNESSKIFLTILEFFDRTQHGTQLIEQSNENHFWAMLYAPR